MKKACAVLVAILFPLLNILEASITYDIVRADCDTHTPDLNGILAKSGSSQELIIVFLAIMYINYL